MPHPRAQEYELPAAVTSGSVKGELVYLEDLQRHQRRSPYNILPGGENQPYYCDNVRPFLYAGPNSNSGIQPVPMYAQTYQDPTNPFTPGVNGSCQYPQITVGGVQDGYQHGKDLWAVYGEKLGLIPRTPNDRVWFRSSDSSLTQASAGAVLRGVWPDYDGDLPLHQMVSSVDTVNEGYSCSAIGSTLNALESTTEWNEHLTVTESLRSTLGSMLDAPPAEPQSPSRNRAASDADYISPTRRSGADEDPSGTEFRRCSSATSRRSGASGIPSLAPRTTLAQRTQGKFTLAGPDETSQLRLAQEPFVQPGYADLNPSYEQPSNARPVWSLAKPLPRVVRPGMVPTKEELLQSRANPQQPTRNSQKFGLEVDPNDLERGRIDKTADPRKMAAQVEDARLQREQNFMNKILSGDATSARQTSRMSRTSSVYCRRPLPWDMPQEHLSTVEEGGSHDDDGQGQQLNRSDELLQLVPEEHEPEGERLDNILNSAELEKGALPEDLHPLVQDLVEDEVHNNHTTWSVIRTHHREALAEALAVFVQLTIGFCADLAVTVANKDNPNTTAWAWGLATMMAIYISGGVSGAHLNPTITMMLWFFRGFPKRNMPEYFVAQFLAAFCAGLAAYGVYYHSIQNYLHLNSETAIITSFVTSQRETWIGPGTAFFNEFIGTVFLAVTILALGDDQNAPPGAGMNSLVIGLVITCLSMTFSYQTGAAFNPSRDFGPRLALLAVGFPNDLFTNSYWFYGPWIGSLSGAFMGAYLYDFFIFTGGESPINYPLERTQRAMKKSGIKWKRRLYLKVN